MYNIIIEAVLVALVLHAVGWNMTMWQWWVGVVLGNVLMFALRKSAQQGVHPTNGGQS